MSGIDFCGRCLRFHLNSFDPSELKVVCYPEGWVGTAYTLSHEEVLDLIKALQEMEPEMCARENAKETTPEEWTRWQLDKLRICTANRARLIAAKDELQKNIRSVEDVRDHSSQFGIRFALEKAMKDVREAIKYIDERIQDCEDQVDAYEDIIARRDMSKTAFVDALCRIIKEREADESQ